MNIGEKIKNARENKNLSQAELAQKSGMSRVAIGNYERGHRIPKIAVLQSIAKTLGITLDDLLEDTELNNKDWFWDDVKNLFIECGYEVSEIGNDGRNVRISTNFPTPAHGDEGEKFSFIFNKNNLIDYVKERDEWIRNNTKIFLMDDIKSFMLEEMVKPEAKKRYPDVFRDIK